ncbi:hypothetical protein ACROYT_G031685 [Oculina patagonica]
MSSPSVQKSFNSSDSLSQEDLDFMATEIKVHFVFLSLTKAQISISYAGTKIIKNKGWTIYFSLSSPFIPHLFRPNRYRLQKNTCWNRENCISVSHIEGHLYKLEPVTEWLTPGSSLTCAIHALPIKLWTRFIVFPNWYIAANGLNPRMINDTANEDLHFVSSTETWNRNRASDSVVNVPDLGHAPLLVIPTPDIITTNESSRKVTVGKEWTVSGDDRLQNEVNFLSGELGLRTSSFNTKSKAILLILKRSSDVPEQFSVTANELYSLEVDASRELITITGEAPTGVFYGVQTLLALIKDSGEVPQVSIKDSPRFSYRGLMVDVARNFKTKQEIFKLLDAMAMYKMNKFYFHLSDSEAWRLKIPGIDELTTIGSKRCHDLQEKRCIMSQLGSGPDTSTSGTGYYTTEDYREILRHATARHIQVIPEFDSPGHSHAAIKSMIARHDRLMQQENEKDAKMFLLTDPEDNSRYITIQGFTVDAVNPCIYSTYQFFDYLLSTLSRLHGDIQPLTLYHFGGDEVPEGVWEDSPECLNYALKGNFTITKRVLMEHFIRNLSRVTQKYGLDIGGWSDAFSSRPRDSEDEVVLNRTTVGNKNVVAYFWGVDREHQTITSLLKEGYKVVISHPKYFYLDHSPEPDFDERGLNWAERFTDIRKTFGYSTLDDQNIMGLEGAMWGELVRTAGQMHGMIFPRLLALAERAWHKASWENLEGEERDRKFDEDWVKFANTLGYRELGRLDKMGVAYRVPPPVARIVCKAVCNRLHVTPTLPGLKVEYSTNDGLTWNDVTAETKVNEEIQLRTRSADQNRFSRVIKLQPLQVQKGNHAGNNKEKGQS